jgi:hypothetical protein
MKPNERAMILLITAMVFTLLPKAFAQSRPAPSPAEKAKGWTLYEDFEGSSSSSGQVSRFDSTVGYQFNRFFAVDVGVPFYFVHASSSTGTTSNVNGLGDAYADLKLTLNNPIVNFASTLRGGVPTGDSRHGLSTGRATADWTNHFDRGFGRWTPYADLGLANTVPDTRFLVRQFSTLGTVAHFDAGMQFQLVPFLGLDVSAYDVLPVGQQKVFSRFVSQASSLLPSGRSRAVGSSTIARDNGFSVGFDAPISFLEFTLGYTRSVHFRQDLIYFGVGANLSSLLRRGSGK